MSDLRAFLQDFATAEPPAPEPDPEATSDSGGVDETKVEALRLESFESGYRAGWDDAVKSQTDDASRLSAGFGQHLQDLSFTYHEAYAHVMTAMTPLLQELVDKVLPQLARDTLGAHVSEQLDKLAQDIGTRTVEIAVSPDMVGAVETLVKGDFSFQIQVVPDENLSDQQADLRFGETEKQIDLAGLMTLVAEAVEGFSHDNLRKLANG